MIFRSSPLFLRRIFNHHPIPPPPNMYHYRFYKCKRYPKCTMRFDEKETLKYHEENELCVPLKERKGYKDSDGDGSSGGEEAREEDEFCASREEEEDLEGFTRKIIQLNDNFSSYRFLNRPLFHKALKEAFEVYCNKGEKLTGEAMEETLGKVVKLLAYIGDKDLFAEFFFYRKLLKHFIKTDKNANDLTVPVLTTGFWPSYKSFDLNSLSKMASPGIDLTVPVLTNGFCPSYKSFDLNIPSKMIPPVDENVIEDVDKDRRYAIDASIKRIIRSRQVLGHQQWVMDYVKKLSCMFKAHPIQKPVEDSYLERGEILTWSSC